MTFYNTGHNFPFLVGGGEMGELTRAYDWAQTSIGTPDTWPESLRISLNIVLNSKFPMFIFWGNESYCFYNDAYRPSLGVDGKHPFALGKPAAIVWPGVWHVIKPLIEQVLSGGEGVWREDQLVPIFRNGQVENVYWTHSHSPICDEAGNPIGVFVACTETTKKITIAQDLLENKEQLEFAIEATELGTFDYSPITKKFSGNNRLKEWFGLPIESELKLDDAINSIAEKDKQRVRDAIQQSLEVSSGGRYDVEYTIIHPVTKTETIVRAKGRSWFNDKKIAYRFNGTLQDVTGQALARKKIEASEERFRMLSEAPDVLIAEGDEKSGAIYFSKAWADLTGRTVEELLDFGWVDLIHPRDKDQYLNIYLSAFKKQIPFKGEFRLLAKDGKFRCLLSQGSPRFLPDGTFVGYISSTVDITERKQAEDALKETSEKEALARQKIEESEERFRTMSEGTDILIAVGDETSNAIYFNKAWIELTGRTMEDLLDFGWSDLIHPEDKQQFLDVFLEAFEKKNPFTGEFRLLNKEGNYTWLLAQGPPRFRPDGSFAGYISSCIDITKRKTDEEALRESAEKQVIALKKIAESEQRFRTLVENAPFPIGVYEGKEMRISLANQAILDIWGKGNDVIGRLYSEVLPEFSKQKIYEQLDGVYTTGIPFHTQNRHIDVMTNGKEQHYYLNNSMTPLYDTQGKVYGVMSTSADVTDLNVAKKKVDEVVEELSKTTKRLQLALEAGELGSYELELLSGKIICTPQCKQNFGLDSDTKFTYEALQKIILPEDRQQMLDAAKDALANNKVYKAQYRVHWKDGSLHWIQAAALPFYNEDGKATQMVGVTVDITKQKLFEQELSKQVQERTEELEEKNRDLVNINTELESFVYVSSHDLQEPLRKMQTFADRLLKTEQNLSENGKDYFNRIQKAAKLMQTLIEDLLAFSRTNKTERIFKKTHLGLLLEEVEEELMETLQAKKATIVLDESTEANIIPFQFKQLFHNLIGNSLKFSSLYRLPVIHIKSEIVSGKKLNDKDLFEENYCHIVVRDNGIGFEPQYSKKIFEVFQRLHNKEYYEGTGIGLAIVKKIVENHNGVIRASGELDKGATFDIYIPIVNREA